MQEVVLKHDEILLGSTHYNTIDVYTRTEADELLNVKANKNETCSKNETNALLDEKVNEAILDDYYSKKFKQMQSKIEDDALLLLKADKTQLIDYYSKSDDDALLLLKVDKADFEEYYLIILVDKLLNDKADKTDLIDSYSNSEDDALFLLKADKTDLNTFVDLQSSQTISGQKQFGTISVSHKSKLSENDASILLAGGGDMLVSTLVNQTELQELRDIAIGKSKGYVFATQEELKNWIKFGLKVQETELPDMSNVVTTLSAATGIGKAIIDLSIDGNTAIPVKNTISVTTGNDQSIIEMKTFTSTIISNGIQYSEYVNNSVFLAEGGIKTKSYINAGVDLNNYYNKTQSYSQTGIDSLLNNKANTGVSYIKGEDDELLLLKADKTQLIDFFTKIQTDNQFSNKTNMSTQYNIDEVYARDEVYTKTETDQLIFQIDSGNIDLNNYYMKTKTDELLDEKADTTDLANYVSLGTT
ncbi:MAG: hypothetical protein EZS28_002624 [Streblomastix strix]|uniref:Uncharacterized protein n=1 Tax=Streblomastix strix TaxID=222440 RepID=A0A5J4X3F1_9EUKA|nr:MAG: hypothetical protein EZS28_002624 [Streblomastix strix]